MSNVIDWFMKNVIGNHTVLAIFYYLPAASGLLYAIYTSIFDYRTEVKKYEEAVRTDDHFSADLSVGEVCGRIFIALCPLFNIIYYFFHVVPDTYEFISRKFGGFFRIKFVKSHKPAIPKWERDRMEEEKRRLSKVEGQSAN